MKINYFKSRGLIISMALFFSVVSLKPAWGEIIESALSTSTPHISTRARNLIVIRRALEKKIVKNKLKAYGFDENKIEYKLKNMTERQIHILAHASDRLLEGGDSGLGVVVTILVILLLVILIVMILDKKIVVK